MHHKGMHTVGSVIYAGTYNNNTNAGSVAQCLQCSPGKYSLTIGSPTDCPACASNSYCQNPTTISPCPAHTTAAASSYSLLQCRCVQGYVCTYSKTIFVSLVFNSTAINFGNDYNGVRTALISTVAEAAGVSASQILIVSY